MKKNTTLIIALILLACKVLAQSYTFNAKGSFRIKNSEGVAESYFYLNTKNGNAGQDTKAWQMMAQENADALIFSLVEYSKKMTQYVQVEGKKHILEMPLSKENYTATQFWKDFKKTGKRQTFGKYPAQEYIGKADGRTLSIWIGEKTYNLQGKLQGDILGLYGVGYLYKPDENVYYLLVHFKDSDGEVTLLDITPFNHNFDGTGYQKMPKIPTQSGNNHVEPNSQNQETPSYLGQYGTTDYKCSTIYEQMIMVIEQSLPSLKEAFKSEQLNAEQKNDLRKQITCLEKKLPILKKILLEAKAIDSRFGNNQQKIMDECTKLQEKYNEILDKVCQ
ncbi:MAG: hypothetical protein MUC49_00865 [Raineya sp.]|jgi:hypothetical protein|nr:hypothetical protein [Raineya sp.]